MNRERLQSSWDNSSGNSASFSDLLTSRLLAANPQLAATFDHWLQFPGMGFQDKNLWWGEHKQRIALHEGIDLIHYYDQQKNRHDLAPGLVVSSLFPGRVAWIQRDFLAWSIYIRHDQYRCSNTVLHTVFAHVHPIAGLLPGHQLQSAEPVARLDSYPLNSPVPLHLHFTAARIAREIPVQQLSWQLLADPVLATLIDPGTICP
jgi:hypothetical protein